MIRVAVLLAAVAALAAACEKSPDGPEEVDHALVRVHDESMVIRHDVVGEDTKWESTATFVLVDVTNRHDEDVMVSLGGELTDEQGEAVADLEKASIRVPAGGQRLFALVAEKNREHPDAVDAHIEVTGAHVPNFERMLVVEKGKAYRDNGRVVVNANITNTADRPVKVIVVAGFYDADEKPLRRPHTVMELGAEESHPALFVGPEGAVSGYIFVSDYVY